MNGIDVFLVVFDLTNEESFEAAKEHLTKIQTLRPRSKVILVGNKSDLVSDRTVDFDEAQKKAKDCKVGYLEVSAKENTNIEKLFNAGIYLAYKSAWVFAVQNQVYHVYNTDST